MIDASFMDEARAALTDLFLNDSAQLLAFTQSGKRPDDGAWTDSGDPFACSLYIPKGGEAPDPLAMLDRELYWFAHPISVDVRPKARVVVGESVYHVHTHEDRTNLFLPRVMVSRLGPYLNAQTGFPNVYPPNFTA